MYLVGVLWLSSQLRVPVSLYICRKMEKTYEPVHLLFQKILLRSNNWSRTANSVSRTKKMVHCKSMITSIEFKCWWFLRAVKYTLSTKLEVKMAGYWPSSLFCVFMDRDEVGIRAGKMGQSEHRIRFILPTGTANDIVVSLLTLTRQ